MTRTTDSADSGRVRRLYEERPYPGADQGARTPKAWKFAPMEWLTALWRPGRDDAAPKRILVAGCGTGREAFALRRKCPKAEIVAVDFSPRSISIAREAQRRPPEMRSIRFLVANLLDRSFAGTVGRDFDFISCHGVLSYVPAPDRALRNLTRCLQPDGALYLGVNGAQHASVGGRLFLPAFGFDLAEYRESPHLRQILQLSDAILRNQRGARLSSAKANYLAGDLFGPLIHNLPLSAWVETARQAGFHFHGSYSCWIQLRPAMEKDYPKLLIPKSRPELCELVESLVPESFHRLLFTLQQPANPPWEDGHALLDWHPVMTGLYAHRLPKRLRSWGALRAVTFKSPATNTQLDWQMPEWELELLRDSDGSHPLRKILERIPFHISPALLKQQLYVLHQLAVICLQSPR
jgi:SAM-dependent methyltransferase